MAGKGKKRTTRTKRTKVGKDSGLLAVQVEVVPVSGAKTTKTVKVAASGATVAEVLNAAGVSAEKKDLLVNGKPATLDTYVTQKDSVEAKEVKVQVSERPAGS